jgi:hypothetical protein
MPEVLIAMEKPENGPGHTTSVEVDARLLFRATVIRGAIDFWLQTGQRVNRAYTPSNLATEAGLITQRSYKRGTKGLAQASRDLGEWIAAAKATMVKS